MERRPRFQLAAEVLVPDVTPRIEKSDGVTGTIYGGDIRAFVPLAKRPPWFRIKGCAFDDKARAHLYQAPLARICRTRASSDFSSTEKAGLFLLGN
jgi:hypothetical protein